MEQRNNVLPVSQEEIQPTAVTLTEKKEESLLLQQVRQKFGIFGGISILFGGLFAFSFYQAGIGVNVPFFTAVIVILLSIDMRNLSLPVKKGTKAYYLGALLLGISTALTASEGLQFLNFIGILMLLNLSLLHQFKDDRKWDFIKYLASMLALFFQSIATIGMPFVDSVHFLKRSKLLKNDKVMNILIGVVIAIPVLWIVIALLASADILFGELTEKIYQFFFSSNIFTAVIMILFGFLSCYCILCGSAATSGADKWKVRKKANSSIAVTAVTLISLVYMLFCGIQLIYLFASGLFVLPEGFTFAEYARRGFFELLAVTIINIVIMLICSSLFEDSKLLRLILTLMTVCTYIMIVSATYRMLLYISAYHLTFLRLFVLLALLIDTFVLAGVIVYQYQRKFPLFPYCAAVVTVCYLVFSFAKPDYVIASYMIEHQELLDIEDASYLTQTLSLDAAPVVLPILADASRWSDPSLQKDLDEDGEEDRGSYEYYIKGYYERLNNSINNTGIRDFNYSYSIAGKYAKKYPEIK
jgi:hypothetical protein